MKYLKLSIPISSIKFFSSKMLPSLFERFCILLSRFNFTIWQKTTEKSILGCKEVIADDNLLRYPKWSAPHIFINLLKPLWNLSTC